MYYVAPILFDLVCDIQTIIPAKHLKNFILVTARTLKTPYAFPVFEVAPDPRCYHYCHLLSPARIMEYIYTDSLRYNLGIQI